MKHGHYSLMSEEVAASTQTLKSLEDGGLNGQPTYLEAQASQQRPPETSLMAEEGTAPPAGAGNVTAGMLKSIEENGLNGQPDYLAAQAPQNAAQTMKPEPLMNRSDVPKAEPPIEQLSPRDFLIRQPEQAAQAKPETTQKKAQPKQRMSFNPGLGL